MVQLSPWYRSPFAHLADLQPSDVPTSADVLAFADDVAKVRSIIGTGLLDKFPESERILMAWEILRKSNEETKH